MQGTVIGVIVGIAFGMWMSIGSNLSFFHRAYLPTVVTNCSLAVNTTVSPIPTNPYVLFHFIRQQTKYSIRKTRMI